MTHLRLGIPGCSGRMGKLLVALCLTEEGVTLSAACARHGSAAVGQDPGPLAGGPSTGLVIGDDPAVMFARADVVIDFTAPDASVRHATLAAQAQVPMVIGTTGLSADERGEIDRAARHVPIVLAANTSLGVTLLEVLVEHAARVLHPDFDIEVLETHHRRKVDAPSGTALALGLAAARGRAVELNEVGVRGRDGHTGPRRRGDIGFAVLRAGDVVGEHTVVFAGDGERIELTHKAGDRAIFARGAIRAARWVRNQAPGLYGMRDVLGIRA